MVIISYHLALDAAVREEEVSVGILPFDAKKTRMVWLPDCEIKLMICITVSTEYRRMTDRRTSCDGIVRAMYMHRAVKIERCVTAATFNRNCQLHC